MRYLLLILRGIGQVMFQNNAYSGALFLIGILCNSWIFALATLLGTLLSTGTAQVLKYSNEDIEAGLYGFNGALVGVATAYFFGFNLIAILALVLGAILSTFLYQYLRKIVPAFTMPFVLIAWLILAVLIFVFDLKTTASAELIEPRYFVLSALANSFGQVMFQENVLTGVFFLLAIFVNSKLSALYAVYAAVIGLLAGFLFLQPSMTIFSGLMGYNAILCALALSEKSKSTFLWILLASILSILLNIWLSKLGVITLTAPFVLATWCILILKKYTVKNKK